LWIGMVYTACDAWIDIAAYELRYVSAGNLCHCADFRTHPSQLKQDASPIITAR